MRAPSPYSALMAVATTMVVLTTGCGGGGSQNPTDARDGSEPTQSVADTSVRPRAEPSASQSATFEDIATWVAEDQGGDQAQVVIAVGKPVPIAQADPVAIECSKNTTGLAGASASRSMLLPFQVRLFVQSSLPAPVQLSLGSGSPYRTSPNPDCNPGAGTYFFSSANFAPRSTYVYTGSVLLLNAITPDHPDGDPKVLKNARLYPNLNVGVLSGGGDEVEASGPNLCGNRGPKFVYLVQEPDDCSA
jgi:hypothetical protein